MLNSPSFDQAQLILRDRMAEVEHQALVHSALSARSHSSVQPAARTHALRAYLAAGLRGLAFRLDSSTQTR
jgi:hypothetical protein